MGGWGSDWRGAYLRALVALRVGWCLGWVGAWGAHGASVLPAAAEGGYSVKTWGTRDGLPQNWVQSLLQTRDGYLWVGTREGLTRFDGARFTEFSRRNVPVLEADHFKALLEDPEGAIWGVTKRGVMRLKDGRFDFYTQAHGIRGEETTSACLSRRGGVWIGTSEGVSLLRAGRITNYTNTEWDHERRFVYALHEDSRGRVLLGLLDGVAALDLATGVLQRLVTTQTRNAAGHFGEEEIVVSFFEEDGGPVWFGTRAGLYVLGENGAERTRLEGASRPHPSARFMARRAEGGFWFGSEHGWFERTADGRGRDMEVPGMAGVAPNCVLEDREGNVWLGTRFHGLVRLQPRQFIALTRRSGLPNDTVWGISEGREGRVWFATDAGISWLQDGRIQEIAGFEYQYGKDRGCRTVIEASDGKVWAASAVKGSLLAAAVRGEYALFGTASGHPQARCVFESQDGNIWVGTRESLAQILTQTWRRLPGGIGAKQIEAEIDHTAGFIYSARGLEFRTYSRQWRRGDQGWENSFPRMPTPLDPALDRPPSPEFERRALRGRLTHYDVRAMVEDRQGVMWIATAGGGLNFLRDGQFGAVGSEAAARTDDRRRTTDVGDATSGQSVRGVQAAGAALGVAKHIHGLHLDAAGALWLATREGLARYKDDVFRVFREEDGMPEDALKFVVEDRLEHLWLGTTRGVVRVERRQLDAVADGRAVRVVPVMFTAEDGLPSDECNGEGQPTALCDAEGRVWIPTTRGIGVAEPRRLRLNDVTPFVTIEAVDSNEQTAFRSVRASSATDAMPVKWRENELVMPPGSGRFLEINYTATCLAGADRVRFRYRLEGGSADGAWRDAGNRRTAFFNNLEPGNYRFRVVASNPHGVWNETGATFAFVIEPFYWQTAWFSGGVIVGVGLLLLFAVRWRLREQAHVHALQRQNAIYAERQRIARDMHDDLGARLNRLALLGSAAEVDGGGMARLARESARVMDEIVWATRPEHDSVTHFADYLGAYASEYLREAGLRVELDLPEGEIEAPLTAAQRHDLVLVAKELLRNVVEHAQARTVWIRVRWQAGVLAMEIADDGVGMKPVEGEVTEDRRPTTDDQPGGGATDDGRTKTDDSAVIGPQVSVGVGDQAVFDATLSPPEEPTRRGSGRGETTGGAGRQNGLGNVRVRVERLGGRVVWETREGGGTRVRVEC